MSDSRGDLLRRPGVSSSYALMSGRFERYNIARNQVGFYTCVGMTARYEIDSEFMSDLENVVFGAVTQLVNTHPVLGLSIINEASLNPSWRRLGQIDLRQVITFMGGDSDLTAVIESAHQQPFENLDTLPLWRLHVLSHQDSITVGFFFHHGICDGLSGVAFHKEFLAALQTSRNSVPSVVDVPKLPLLPSLEEMHPLPLSLYFIATQLIKSILPGGKDNLCWTGGTIRTDPPTTSLRILFFDVEIVQTLSKICQSHKVTITALLTVMIAHVLGRDFPEFERFSSGTAMSFRRFTDTPSNAMLLSVTSFGHRFSKTQKNAYIECGDWKWDAVKTCHSEIQTATASPKNSQVGLLRFLNDYGGWLGGRVGQKRDHSFEVSNVGITDGGIGGGKPRIKSLLFSQPRNVTGAALVFSVASVKGGDMGISVTWQEGVVEREKAEKVLADLDAELRKLA